MSGEKRRGVVVGGPGKWQEGGRRRLFMLAAALLLVLLAGGLAFMLLSDNSPSRAKEEQAAAEKTVNQAVSKKVADPNYAAATKELSDQLGETEDKKKQAEIHVGLASVALQQSRYQEVVDHQLAAAKLDPSRADSLARTTADAYLQLGNEPEALKYYKQALAFYNSRPDDYSGKTYYINTMNSKISELEK